MEFSLRDAGPGDEPVLWEMLHLAIFVPAGTDPPANTIVAQPELARYVSGWGRRGDEGTIAQAADGSVLGAAWLRLWSDRERGYAFIDERTPELSVAVRPEFRGRGIGTAMLRRLLAVADVSYGSVSLSVSIQNPARRLYERFGFVPVSADASAIVMKRTRSA